MTSITLEGFVIIRRTVLAVPVALAALSLAACSSGGGSSTSTNSAGVVVPAESSSAPSRHGR
ncbi:hypothetical protein AB0F52_30120 [Amycolatopsis sp. NPDC024027]|uniref:hypothetical protein n=1 Tax=Amycolatopsis sp. NPDC024027 TaxID=3154327 RepID=UPI0033E955D3